MLYPVLTYSRNLGDFTHNLTELYKHGLKAIRLIYKGKSESEFINRVNEIQNELLQHSLQLDIIIDLQGNKPTVGNFLNKGLNIVSGEEYHLVEQCKEKSMNYIPTINFINKPNLENLKVGETISVADDELNLTVKNINEHTILCEANNSYFLASNRSMSVKDYPCNFMANSERDIQLVRNLELSKPNMKLLVSFTQKADDILTLKKLQPKCDIIPKIENVLDEKSLSEILNCCNTVMLGRGDLSISNNPNQLFAFQNKLIETCKNLNKQIVIGTGLLSGIGDKSAPSISEIMDYSYLRIKGVNGFLITGSNANLQPIKTLKYMSDFEC